MKLYILGLLFVVAEISGCGKKAAPTTTTTTTTTPKTPVEDVIVKANDASNTNSAWTGKKDWSVHRSSGGTSSVSNRGSPAAQPNIPPRVATNSGGKKSVVETSELRAFSEELYALDTNSVGSRLTLNYQGKTSSSDRNDVAPQPLFSNVNPEVLRRGAISSMVKLFDNYVPDVRGQEDNTGQEKMEVNAFLDAILKTDVMKRTEEFLRSKGLISGKFRDQLKQIWFNFYPRAKGVTGSSGFEHVFLGELKDGKVSGFHNWVFFQQEEQQNDLNYKGYMKSIDLGNTGEIIKMRFDWLNKRKTVGSMFVGTSPELEMALYTLCFYTRGNKGCNLQMNKNRFRIKVYKQSYQGKQFVGSAFPEVF